MPLIGRGGNWRGFRYQRTNRHRHRWAYFGLAGFPTVYLPVLPRHPQGARQILLRPSQGYSYLSQFIRCYRLRAGRSLSHGSRPLF